MSSDYHRWLAIGTGVGIEIDQIGLDITMVRVRPSGTEVLGAMRIERFADRPAAEWGVEYAKFLKRLGGSYLAATVLLPRSEVIVRQISMPGVSDRDLPQAVAFQIDGLHPYNEGEAIHSWARLDGTGNVLVGITRREIVDRYASLFAEAGIKVAAFTFSAAVLYSSLRIVTRPPRTGFIAVHESPEGIEAYGESEARPLFSAVFDDSNEHLGDRARNLALAELRLPPETEPMTLEEVVPKPRRFPEGFHLGRRVLAYTTAMTGACPRLGIRINLLPSELRAASSRMMFVPSIVLGALLVAGAGSLAAYSSYEDRQYLNKLQSEIARLDPESRKPIAMDQAVNQARARTLILDQFRKRTHADLEVLHELTRILEPPAWLNGLEISRDSIRMSGEAAQAPGLLRLMDQSPLFEGSEFAAPMARSGGGGEVFAIRARREQR